MTFGMRPQFFWACGLLYRGSEGPLSVAAGQVADLRERTRRKLQCLSESRLGNQHHQALQCQLCSVNWKQSTNDFSQGEGNPAPLSEGRVIQELVSMVQDHRDLPLHYSLALLYTWLVHWFSPWQRHEVGEKCIHPFPLGQQSHRLFLSGCDWRVTTQRNPFITESHRGDNFWEGVLNPLNHIP